MLVIGKSLQLPMNWKTLTPSVLHETDFGNMKLDSADSKQQIEMIFVNQVEVLNFMHHLETLLYKKLGIVYKPIYPLNNEATE